MENENKYRNGKIYKIVDVGYSKCYFGSTYNTLCKRMSKHKESYRSFLNNKCPRTSSYDLFDEFGLDNCKIELVELYPCNNREELNAREGFWIKQTECVNKVIVGRTKREYYEQHKIQDAARRKLYFETHKEQESKRKQDWYQANKDRLNERASQKYQEKREAILAKHREKVECQCGCVVSRYTLKAQMSSKKHEQIMENKM